MMKLITTMTLLAMLPLGGFSQDDMYFVPGKDSEVAEENITSEVWPIAEDYDSYSAPTTGSLRDVDEYNRMGSYYYAYEADTAAMDTIGFDGLQGYYPEYESDTLTDYQCTRQMSRFDDYVWADPYWAGYWDGRYDYWLWDSFWPYYSWYWPWGYYSWHYTYWYHGWWWHPHTHWGVAYVGRPFRGGVAGTRNHGYGYRGNGRPGNASGWRSSASSTRSGTTTSGSFRNTSGSSRNTSTTTRQTTTRFQQPSSSFRSGSNSTMQGGSFRSGGSAGGSRGGGFRGRR